MAPLFLISRDSALVLQPCAALGTCPTAATDPGKIAGSRTLAGARLSEWERMKAPGGWGGTFNGTGD